MFVQYYFLFYQTIFSTILDELCKRTAQTKVDHFIVVVNHVIKDVASSNGQTRSRTNMAVVVAVAVAGMEEEDTIVVIVDVVEVSEK